MKYRIIEDCGPLGQDNLDWSYEHDYDYCSYKAAEKVLKRYGYIDPEGKVRVMRHYGDAFFTFRIIQK